MYFKECHCVVNDHYDINVTVQFWRWLSIYILFRFRERGSWEFSGAPQATCSPKIYLLPNLVVFSLVFVVMLDVQFWLADAVSFPCFDLPGRLTRRPARGVKSWVHGVKRTKGFRRATRVVFKGSILAVFLLSKSSAVSEMCGSEGYPTDYVPTDYRLAAEYLFRKIQIPPANTGEEFIETHVAFMLPENPESIKSRPYEVFWNNRYSLEVYRCSF